MAFSSIDLTIGRGLFNSFSSSVSKAIHLYVSQDSILEITSLNYFPSYFGFNEANFHVNDVINIVSVSDSINLLFLITSLDPVSLTGLTAENTKYYNYYPGASLSGALTGAIDIAFSRNSEGFVTFYVCSSISIVTNVFTTINVSIPGGLPSIYRPNSLYGSYGVSLPMPVVTGPSATENFEVRINTGINFALMESGNIPAATWYIRNYSGVYIGAN